jgi:hypothetical protein
MVIAGWLDVEKMVKYPVSNSLDVHHGRQLSLIALSERYKRVAGFERASLTTRGSFV